MIYGGKLFQSLIVLGQKLYVSIINLLGPFALAINDPHDIFTSRLDFLVPMEDQRELLGELVRYELLYNGLNLRKILRLLSLCRVNILDAK